MFQSNRAATVALSLCLTAALVGCKDKGKDEAGKQSEPAAKKETKPVAPPAKLAPDFSAWDPAGKAKAWTGSWVLMDNGSYQAWTVSADGKVDVWEDGKDKSYKLVADIPCYAYFATDSGMMFPHPFTVMPDGTLRSNGMGGGYRNGNQAIYCDGSSTVYMLAADGTCTAWKKDFQDWKKEPAECSLGKDAEGKDVFEHGDPNGGEFAIEGDAILGGTKPTEKAADHAAAVAAATAKNAAR